MTTLSGIRYTDNLLLADLQILLHDWIQLEQVAMYTGHSPFVLLSIHSDLHHALCKAAGGQRFAQLTFLQVITVCLLPELAFTSNRCKTMPVSMCDQGGVNRCGAALCSCNLGHP